MPRSCWLIGLAGLTLLAATAVVGSRLRQPPSGRCALDGTAIEPRYRVHVRDRDGRDYEFCCVRCAELWLGRRKAGDVSVSVTDEAFGREIDAASAYFVRSMVVTAPATGCRVHAFADKADAERHAESAHGQLLSGSDRPFAAE
jgi:hypothetical protein